MLKNCAKTLLKCRTLNQTYRILEIQNYATFGVKDVLYETSDEAGTLLTRFSKHIAMERSKICKLVPTDVRYSDYFPISDIKYFQKELRKTPKEQIAAVVIFASTYRSNAEPAKFAAILNELDRFALENLDDMDVDSILRTLYAFLFIIPNWMTRLDFYGRSLKKLLDEGLQEGCTSKEHFVQLSFYLGLNKKQSKIDIGKLFKTLLDTNLNKFLPEMTSIDMALISNAAFKTSTVINSDEFNQRLLKEVLNISSALDGNDALLITFIKSMRLQRLRSPIVCEYVSNFCQDKQKLKYLQPRGLVHLFAYLAESLWDSEESTQPFIETFMNQLKGSRSKSYVQTIRGKDIETFLWSCAQLNCNLSSSQFEIIENSLVRKLHANEFNYFVDQLVNSCLSLWILGHHSEELLQAAIQLKSDSPFKRQQPKVDSRLTVLLSAAKIEKPLWCSDQPKGVESFNLKAKVPSYLLDTKDIPYQQLISQLLKEEGVSSASLSCPINGINIPGIHVKFSSHPDNQIFMEFMSPSQTLQFSKQPVAILRLKLRLLQSLGKKVKVITPIELSEAHSIKDLLLDCLPEGDVNDLSENSIKA